MVRKLIKPMLSLTLMTPAVALALGLGDVKLHSALNQNLNADIELLSVESGDLEQLSVSMASSETFAKLGLNRPAVLLSVQFEIKQHPNGTYYVNATTKNAIREPFLDFLVEAKWKTGRVLREYTLLLDPPTRHTEMAAPVNAATAGSQSAVVQPAPLTTSQPAPMNQPQAAVTTPMKQQESVTYYPSQQQTVNQVGGTTYGPVRSGDTLWEIALKVRPNRSITAHQMMLALLKANPHAFVDNNINRLKKGFVLRIDDPSLYTAMSQAEAVREVARQNRAWQDYREAVAAKSGERQTASAVGGTSRSTASRKSEPKLKLVAPNGKKSVGAGAGSEMADADAQEQLMLALESSAAQRKENEELQGRVDDMEAQLQDMQRLLTLKDSDMAALQKQLREQGAAATLPSEQAAAEVKTEPKSNAKAAEKTSEAKQPGKEEVKPAEAAAAAKQAAAEKPAKPEQKPKPKPKPRVMPQPKPEPSFIDMLLGDQLMLMAGGGVIVLLLLLGLVISRRRSKGGFQESILSGGTSSMLNASDDENRSETSFLSDLAISGMGGGAISADEGEVDPITEADVFMAYGRYQQAEEVLKKALDANPERPDVTSKLFEVYFNTREKDKFDDLANSVGSSLQGNDEVWPSIAAMGKEISPDNPLFAAVDTAEVAPSTPAPKPEPITDDVLDIGLDLDELSAEMEGEADASDSLDLGLELGDLESPSSPEVEAPIEEPAGDLDFDLDFGDESTAEVSAPQSADSDDLNDLDFDLGGIGDESEEPAPVTAESESESIGDMDLGDLDFGDLSDSGTADEPADTSLDLSDLDTGDAADDFGDLTADLDTDVGSTDTASSGDDVFGDGDEISTKLDLAQAYIEMGDGEGARSMLDEVVMQGNAQQKQQAESLLSRI